MREKMIFCSSLSFMAKVKIPISEIRLTRNVLRRIQTRTMREIT